MSDHIVDANKLMPCPFCGSEAYISYQPDNDWPRCVECDNYDCEAMGPWAKIDHNHEQALAHIVAGWNKRAEQRAEPK